MSLPSHRCRIIVRWSNLALHHFILSLSFFLSSDIPACVRNLLQLPLLGKLLAQMIQILHNVPTRLQHGILGRQRSISLHAQLKVRHQRVRNHVSREKRASVLAQPTGDEVAERVVFLVESKACGVGNTYVRSGTEIRSIWYYSWDHQYKWVERRKKKENRISGRQSREIHTSLHHPCYLSLLGSEQEELVS